MRIIVEAELVSKREDFGGYIVYVFRNLEKNLERKPEGWKRQYIMTVRFPNWQTPFINEGDVGFLEYKEVKAGEDVWWDNVSNMKVAYKYDNVIFINFVYKTEKPNLTVTL